MKLVTGIVSYAGHDSESGKLLSIPLDFMLKTKVLFIVLINSGLSH